jgi:hypothetical protein
MTSEDVVIADSDTSTGIDFRPKLRPMSARRRRKRWTTTLAIVTGRGRDEHLGPSRPDHWRMTWEPWHPAQLTSALTQTGEAHLFTRGCRGWKQPTAAASRHRTARQWTSATLRPRDKYTRWNVTPIEATISHMPPPNSLWEWWLASKSFPELNMGKVDLENPHPTANHYAHAATHLKQDMTP